MIICNGSVALKGHPLLEKVDIRVEDGRIVEIGSKLLRKNDEEVLDVEGLMVMPGAIDPHVHFDTPGFETRESFLRGSAEAAKGG
ncbi:hypothetical protein MASR2M78_20420 [Treponema sp.]